MLEKEAVNISILTSTLEITYSSLIFEYSLKDSKEELIESLKCLIKADILHLDSTGAFQAIVGNCLNWVENTNDFFGINRSQGIAVNQDLETTKYINGLLKLLKAEEEEYKSRISELANAYGETKIDVAYPDFSVFSDVPNSPSYVHISFEEVKCIDQLILETDPIKMSENEAKTIKTFVYKAVIKENGQKVAVKKIKALGDINDLSKYNQETEIMRKLSGKHSSFLKFYGSFILKNELYIVMEYVEDTLMDKMQPNVVLNEINIIEITKQLINGFAYMEQLHISHRDIKPHNILITSNNTPKIIDFGITIIDKSPNLSTILITNKKLIQGTAGYMSPEQKLAYDQYKRDGSSPFKKYDPYKSDVFSLGLTIYQLITRTDVSQYEDPNKNQDLMKKINDLSSAKLKNLLLKMLCLNPDSRFKFNQLIGILGGVTITSVIN